MTRSTFAICLAGLLGVACSHVVGQGPGEQHDSYFPPPRAASSDRAVERDLANIYRRLRKGSGADRAVVRAELMAQSDTYLGAMLKELRSGSNHFLQRHICLVLSQVRDPRAQLRLIHLVAGGRRGTRGLAGLALGKLGDPACADALRNLMTASSARAQQMAYLALGRLGAPGASKVLIQRVKMGRPARETEGILLALGLTRDHVVLPHLERMSKQRKDGLRRAAVIALGYLEQDLVAPLLIVRADQRKEEDKMVRILALTGLARMQPDPELFLELMRRRPDAISDADEEAAWVLGLAALGGTDALREVAQYAKKNHREQVRCAAMAATIVIGGKDARALAQRLMNDDKDVVQRAALLAMIVHSRVNSDPMLVEAFVNNTDEQIRRTAVCGLVYLRGAAARAQLVRYLDNKYKDDVRELAKALIVELDRDERAARMINRARLQVLLDQNGWAPSWNLNRAANALIYRILNLENALSRRGAGQAPGASGGGPDRGRAAAATAPSPEEEDLRHHLDRHPYIDQRDHIEFPPVW